METIKNLKEKAEIISKNIKTKDDYLKFKRKSTIIITLYVVLFLFFVILGLSNEKYYNIFFNKENFIQNLSDLIFLIFSPAFIFFYIKNKYFPNIENKKNLKLRKIFFYIFLLLTIIFLINLFFIIWRSISFGGIQNTNISEISLLLNLIFFMASLFVALLARK